MKPGIGGGQVRRLPVCRREIVRRDRQRGLVHRQRAGNKGNRIIARRQPARKYAVSPSTDALTGECQRAAKRCSGVEILQTDITGGQVRRLSVCGGHSVSDHRQGGRIYRQRAGNIRYRVIARRQSARQNAIGPDVDTLAGERQPAAERRRSVGILQPSIPDGQILRLPVCRSQSVRDHRQRGRVYCQRAGNIGNRVVARCQPARRDGVCARIDSLTGERQRAAKQRRVVGVLKSRISDGRILRLPVSRRDIACGHRQRRPRDRRRPRNEGQHVILKRYKRSRRRADRIHTSSNPGTTEDRCAGERGRKRVARQESRNRVSRCHGGAIGRENRVRRNSQRAGRGNNKAIAGTHCRSATVASQARSHPIGSGQAVRHDRASIRCKNKPPPSRRRYRRAADLVDERGARNNRSIADGIRTDHLGVQRHDPAGFQRHRPTRADTAQGKDGSDRQRPAHGDVDRTSG